MVAAKENPAKRTRTQAATKGTKKSAPAEPVEEQASVSVDEPQQVSETPSDPDDYKPEEFESKDVEQEPIKHFGPPKGLYPDDAELYSYTSKTTGQTIWFPMKFESPKFSQVWETYDMKWHVQTWEYMRWAEIPKPMQRMAAQLFDVAPDEYMELFNGWIKAVGGMTLGE